MWSTAEVASNARRDGDREGATGPYIPSFSESERSNLAMNAGAMGEARFEDAESADEPINPSSVLEGTESADEPTDPPSVFVRMERTQPTESLESTDGSMYPARVELAETSDRLLSLEETRPLVVTELDAVHGSSGFISNLSDATISTVPVSYTHLTLPTNREV